MNFPFMITTLCERLEEREHSLHFCHSTDDYSKFFQVDLYFEMIIVDISNYKQCTGMQSFNGKIEHHISNEKKNCGHTNVEHSC